MQPTRAISSRRRTDWTRALDAVEGRLGVAIRVAMAGLDAGFVWLAFWLAYQVRYRYEVGGAIRFGDWEPFATFHNKSALFVGLTVAVFLVRGVYRVDRSTAFLDEALLVAGGLTTAMAGVILTAFLARFVPSRLVFIYAWGLAIALLLGRRLLSRWARQWLWAHEIGVDRVLVVGAGDSGRRLMQAMMGTPALGYRVVGFVDDELAADEVAVATAHGVRRVERLGTADDVGGVVRRLGVDEVIIALPADAHDRVLAIIDQCRRQDVTFKVVPDLLQLSLDRVDLAEVAGIPLIGLKDASIRGLNYAAKRTIDIVIATAVLAAMSLPMAVIALAIRRDSPGPVLYRQRRVGRNGETFLLYKFRCMVEDADAQRAELMRQNGDQDPRLFKLRDDPRVTRVGRFLRRWSLDELPQFVHIVRGHMSLIGPRPQLPEEVATYEEWHRQRLLITPGLTGLWQVNGRSNLTFDEMVRLDLYYAEHWSPWLDLKIVLKTVPAVLAGRGAY